MVRFGVLVVPNTDSHVGTGFVTVQSKPVRERSGRMALSLRSSSNRILFCWGMYGGVYTGGE
jgi:hypothetical protein